MPLLFLGSVVAAPIPLLVCCEHAGCSLQSMKLTSTKCTDRASAKPRSGAVPRSASAMRVPRPGPSSTRRNAGGLPSACHTVTAQMPIICSR